MYQLNKGIFKAKDHVSRVLSKALSTLEHWPQTWIEIIHFLHSHDSDRNKNLQKICNFKQTKIYQQVRENRFYIAPLLSDPVLYTAQLKLGISEDKNLQKKINQ